MSVTSQGGVPATHGNEWPAGVVDVAALRASGWRPTPFRQFVVKVHSRCNLACDYCYVYEMADSGWRRQPAVMSEEVVARTAARIAEHAVRHGLTDLRIVLHGGEPLLAGRRSVLRAIDVFTETIGPGVAIDFGIQSNGILLDEDFLEGLLERRVRIGVSVDGGRGATDRHRRYRDGRGSHDAVSRALGLLARPRYRPVYAGLLATIDLANDPVRTYQELLEFTPPAVDFLLPQGNWTTPPPHRGPGGESAPYADWLISLFDRWYGAAVRETGVRLFDEIINLLLGGHSAVESVGLSPVGLVVVETDGSLEQVDTLKSAYQGASGTGLTVFADEFDTALETPAIAARQLGARGLCPTCRACRLLQVCGGGLYTHRYREGSGFLNPSVYCPDLTALIDHIHLRVADDLRHLRPA